MWCGVSVIIVIGSVVDGFGVKGDHGCWFWMFPLFKSILSSFLIPFPTFNDPNYFLLFYIKTFLYQNTLQQISLIIPYNIKIYIFSFILILSLSHPFPLQPKLSPILASLSLPPNPPGGASEAGSVSLPSWFSPILASPMVMFPLSNSVSCFDLIF
jgi:hypothetical protein